jgi:hypothetical protein
MTEIYSQKRAYGASRMLSYFALQNIMKGIHFRLDLFENDNFAKFPRTFEIHGLTIYKLP